ncbi:hypothetical protein KXW47_005990, partial [Aspergillus fumigatus]
MCSYCYVERLQMMQRTPYSVYDEYYQTVLKTVHERCGLTGPTDIPPSPITLPEQEEPICLSGTKLTTVEGDTCDSIAQTNSLSSAALYMGNQDQIYNCSKIEANLNLCLPLPCGQTYVLQPDDTCTSIESATSLQVGDLRAFNPWISFACDNLHIASKIYGKTLCLTPQGGVHNSSAPNNGSSTTPSFSDGYVYATTLPPTNATIAEGSTTNCGRWHEARENETCAAICVEEGITSPLFLAVNPSLNPVDWLELTEGSSDFVVSHIDPAMLEIPPNGQSDQELFNQFVDFPSPGDGGRFRGTSHDLRELTSNSEVSVTQANHEFSTANSSYPVFRLAENPSGSDAVPHYLPARDIDDHLFFEEPVDELSHAKETLDKKYYRSLELMATYKNSDRLSVFLNKLAEFVKGSSDILRSDLADFAEKQLRGWFEYGLWPPQNHSQARNDTCHQLSRDIQDANLVKDPETRKMLC